MDKDGVRLGCVKLLSSVDGRLRFCWHYLYQPNNLVGCRCAQAEVKLLDTSFEFAGRLPGRQNPSKSFVLSPQLFEAYLALTAPFIQAVNLLFLVDVSHPGCAQEKAQA